jgi:hypothetical protein
MLIKIEAMNRLTLPSLTLLLHRFIAIPLIPNLSDFEYIWFRKPIWSWTYLIRTCLIRTYLIPNLYDSEPNWFRTPYLVPKQSDSKPIWFSTYLIPNLSNSKPIFPNLSFQTYLSKPMWFRIYLILILTFLNPSDTEPVSIKPNACVAPVTPSPFNPETTADPS